MQQQELIERLSNLCDLIGLAGHIGQATEWGDKPANAGSWQLTRQYLAEYGEPGKEEEVIALLEEAGAYNDMEAATWIATHEGDIP